jgi:hypothetical protein
MLMTELCTSKGLKECDAVKALDGALAKAQLRLPEPM